MTEAEFNHLLHLTRLSSDEPQQLKQLENVIQMVNQLLTVDTTGVEPMAHPLDCYQPLREDEVTEPENANAELYLVPLMIE